MPDPTGSKYWVLHGRPIDPAQWWACSHPERPPDNCCVFELFCPGCFAAAEAHAALHPDTMNLESSPQRPEGEERRLSETLALHVEIHGRPSPMNAVAPPPADVDPEQVLSWPIR